MNYLEFGGLLIAGFFTGLVGQVTGLASVVSYPALLASGLTPVAANATNTVALIGVGVGATARASHALTGRGRELHWWMAISVVGGALGAWLVLAGSESTFETVVPICVALGGLALLLQPRLQRVVAHWDSQALTAIGLFLVAIYVGYFGAGGGVVLLALILIFRSHETMQHATVLKSFLLGLSNLVAAIGFSIFGPVDWWAALALGIGALVGGWTGPSVVTRLPADALRIGIAVLAFLLAAALMVG